MATKALTSDKLIPHLEGHKPGAPDGGAADLKHALVVLGPQVHKGKRYQAVGIDGQVARSVPLNKDGEYDPARLRIEVTSAPIEAADGKGSGQ